MALLNRQSAFEVGLGIRSTTVLEAMDDGRWMRRIWRICIAFTPPGRRRAVLVLFWRGAYSLCFLGGEGES
jgi:hypothetical protein